MYSINGDISDFDDYAVEIDEEYLLNDYDVVEQNSDTYSNQIDSDTDIQFE